MNKPVCDITGKDIGEKEPNFGREPLVVPITEELSVHLQFVDRQGRCSQSDVGPAAMPAVLDAIAKAVPNSGTKSKP